MTTIPNEWTMAYLERDFAKKGSLWRLACRPRWFRIARALVDCVLPVIPVVLVILIIYPAHWLFDHLNRYVVGRADAMDGYRLFEAALRQRGAQPPAQPPVPVPPANVAAASGVMPCDEGRK